MIRGVFFFVFFFACMTGKSTSQILHCSLTKCTVVLTQRPSLLWADSESSSPFLATRTSNQGQRAKVTDNGGYVQKAMHSLNIQIGIYTRCRMLLSTKKLTEKDAMQGGCDVMTPRRTTDLQY